jgi:hypothetical protein
MKFTHELRDALKNEFPQYANLKTDEVLTYYGKKSLPELEHSILIFEKGGKPYIATAKGNETNIPFSLHICDEHIKSLTAEVESLKKQTRS